MEVLTKLRRVVPCSFRYLTLRYSSSSNIDKDKLRESETPFSRKGDNGFSLMNNKPLPKDDRLLCAIGDTDELMCHLGVTRENAILSKHPYIDKLTRIQTMLVDIILAISKQNGVNFSSKNTKELEEWIVQYSKELTPAENYLLPGGGRVSTSLHVARSVCRRAERSVFPLVKDGQLDKEVQVYFNRLGDLLFTWARYSAKQDERSESVYTPKTEQKKQPESKQDPNESTPNQPQHSLPKKDELK